MGSRYQFTERKRRIIFALTDGKCWYCGADADTIDHMQPRSKGGDNRYGNLVPCCDACNQRKSDNSVEQYRKQLVNVTVNKFRFANKEARRMFIGEFRFYGEINNIDPYLPARLAMWSGLQHTIALIEIHDLSFCRDWAGRIRKWFKNKKGLKRLRWQLSQRFPSLRQSDSGMDSNTSSESS